MLRFRLKELIADYEFKHSRRLTLGELAAKTGIKRWTLSRIAGTKGYNTTTDNLDLLCEFFNCSMGELLVHIPEHRKPRARRT